MRGSSLAVAAVWILAAALPLHHLWDAAQDEGSGPRRSAFAPLEPLRPGQASALFLGDSVGMWTGGGEATDTPLYRLLAGELRSRDAGPGLRESCEMGRQGWAYDEAVQDAWDAGIRPAWTVILVNPRSLNAKGANGFNPWKPAVRPLPGEAAWGWGGERLRSLRVAARRVARAAVLALHAQLLEPFQPAPVRTEGARSRRARVQDLPEALRRFYGDGFSLDPDALAGLRNAGDRAVLLGGSAAYFVAPVDWRRVRAMAGDANAAQLEAGIAEAVRTLRAKGFTVLDYSRLFDAGFADPPTEHLDLPRRRRLARRLAEDLGPWMAKHPPKEEGRP